MMKTAWSGAAPGHQQKKKMYHGFCSKQIQKVCFVKIGLRENLKMSSLGTCQGMVTVP
jgi:hypothetical protein